MTSATKLFKRAESRSVSFTANEQSLKGAIAGALTGDSTDRSKIKEDPLKRPRGEDD